MTTPVAAFAAALVARVHAAGLSFIAAKLVWSVDPEYPGGLIAKAELAKGELSVRVSASWEDPLLVQGAVNWSGNRSFTCGAYTEKSDRLFWDLACAVQFASSHGVLPSEDD